MIHIIQKFKFIILLIFLFSCAQDPEFEPILNNNDTLIGTWERLSSDGNNYEQYIFDKDKNFAQTNVIILYSGIKSVIISLHFKIKFQKYKEYTRSYINATSLFMTPLTELQVNSFNDNNICNSYWELNKPIEITNQTINCDAHDDLNDLLHNVVLNIFKIENDKLFISDDTVIYPSPFPTEFSSNYFTKIQSSSP